MDGYTTLIANAVLLIASGLALVGIEVGIEEQSAIVVSVVAIGNIILRIFTKTPVLNK